MSKAARKEIPWKVYAVMTRKGGIFEPVYRTKALAIKFRHSLGCESSTYVKRLIVADLPKDTSLPAKEPSKP